MSKAGGLLFSASSLQKRRIVQQSQFVENAPKRDDVENIIQSWQEACFPEMQCLSEDDEILSNHDLSKPSDVDWEEFGMEQADTADTFLPSLPNLLQKLENLSDMNESGHPRLTN